MNLQVVYLPQHYSSHSFQLIVTTFLGVFVLPLVQAFSILSQGFLLDWVGKPGKIRQQSESCRDAVVQY